MNFFISKKGLSFQSTLKLHKNHNLNHFVPTHILLKRLCPRPPDPYRQKAESLSYLDVLLALGMSIWLVC
jgi:hypothetical protein